MKLKEEDITVSNPQEDDNTGRQLQRNTTTQEDNLTGRQHDIKLTLQEEKIKGTISFQLSWNRA